MTIIRDSRVMVSAWLPKPESIISLLLQTSGEASACSHNEQDSAQADGADMAAALQVSSRTGRGG